MMKMHPPAPTIKLARTALLGLLLGPLLCLLVAVIGCKPQMDPALKELADQFRAANQADTIGPMLKLYNLDGCDAAMTSRLKGALKYELGLTIKEISFEPLTGAAEETIQFKHNGITYGPSLEPSYRMRVIYSEEENFSSLFTIGQNSSEEWQIICAKPLEAIRY